MTDLLKKINKYNNFKNRFTSCNGCQNYYYYYYYYYYHYYYHNYCYYYYDFVKTLLILFFAIVDYKTIHIAYTIKIVT